MFLTLNEATKRFGAIVAVDRIDLAVENGELVCFLGPSGCGKTTLLRLIAGLEGLDGGAIAIEGRDLTAVPARLRNFGVVFQSYSLFPNMTVARNIAYGLECRKWPRPQIDERVAAMLELVHLAGDAEKHPHELSGGMQQRVALARALAPEPELLLLDEPLSALDAKVRESLRGEIRDLQQRLGITTIMVTHDQGEAMEMADRIVVMNRGKVEQIGTAEELYWRPQTRFVGEFIGRLNVLDTPEWRRLLSIKPGELVAIRPEHVNVVDDAAPQDGVFEGEVRKATFLGNTLRLLVDSNGQQLEFELHGSHLAYQPGDAIRFELPEDRRRRLRGAP